MSRSLTLGALLLAPLVFATGCGETCTSTCQRAYGETECNLSTNGLPREERISRCTSDCQAALEQVGPIGDYSPFASGAGDVAITNERQAAAWMDCIAESTCEALDSGRCNPL